jgi:pilus assembly protein CpaD
MRAAFSSFAKAPLALAVVLAVAGCASRQDDITGSIPDDYRLQHPINVTRGLASIDLLPGGGPGGLTDRQVADIQAFGADWRRRGRGRLSILVPTGAGEVTDKQSARAAKEIRRIFSAMGIPGQSFVTERYPADGPGHLAPVRLEFPVLEAKLSHECGQWPDDAGYSQPGTNNENRSMWNYGCSTQQNLAAQVEDPEDFIRPRSEDPASAARRSTVIGKYRKGEATPSTYTKETVDTQ